MSFEKLSLALNFGRYLGVTPRYPRGDPKTPNPIHRFVVVTVCVLLAVGVVASCYFRIPLYSTFGQIKLVICILGEVFLYGFNFHTMMGMGFWKRTQWDQLLKNLEDSEHDGYVVEDRKPTKIPYYLEFVVSNIIFVVVIIYNIYVWNVILGPIYYPQYLLGMFQMYVVYYYTLPLSAILRMLGSRYQQLNHQISQQLFYATKLDKLQISPDNFVNFVKKIEKRFYLLKETIDLFNDIFGWPMVLIVFFSGIVLLNYSDDIFKNSYDYSTDILLQVVLTNVGIAATSFVTCVVVIMQCGRVLDESNNVLSLCYKLRKHFPNVMSKERQELNQFISFALYHVPEFSAAGFMNITRTTVFHILGTTTTYLIVVIQFNASGDASAATEAPTSG